MAWVFVRLKARLLANGLKGQGWRLVGLVFGIFYAVVLAVAGFAVLAASHPSPADAEGLAVLFGSALAVGWATFPMLGFGSDETLDPIRLALLPLTRRQLLVGLLAASMLGIGPLATAIALSGGIVGFAPLGPGAVLVALAVPAELMLCITLSRAVVTALSAALRSRRGRDLKVILVALVALAPQALRIAFVGAAPTGLSTFRPLARVMGWLPWGWPMRAMVAAGRGRLLVAAVELAGTATAIAALLGWWAHSLDRVTTTAERPARLAVAKSTTRAGPAPDPLFGLLLAWLPRTRTGAVAARETRVTWRDPRRRAGLVSTVLLPFILLGGVIARGSAHHPSLVYFALLTVFFGGSRANNQLGMDGRAWWVHEASGTDLNADLRGKNLSLLVTTMPSVVASALVLAVLTGGWRQLLTVMPLAVALTGAQMGIGSMLSVRAPWPVPSSSTNAWATNTGQGCLAGLLVLLSTGALAVLAGPVLVAMLVVHSPTGQFVIGLLSLPCGYGLWRIGCRRAVSYGSSRGPELLLILSSASGPG